MAGRSQDGEQHGLWAVTTYWNPMRYRRRYANYRVFRRHLGVPLLAVELAYDGGFELADGDADLIVRLHGHDVMWQKERLLNVALRALPESCHTVVWVDCDVVFASPDWASRTLAALEHDRLVQPFSAVHRMSAGWEPGLPRPASTVVRRPAPALIAAGMPVAMCLGTPAEEIGCCFGFVWAARRDLLDDFGLYDACIVGGGDSVLIRSAYGYLEDGVRLHLMNAERREHYLRWAQPFRDAVRGAVGFIDGELLHLWHGRTENRRYRQRLEDLSHFDFDPQADIVVDAGGAWRWHSDKPAMHAYVRDYFAARMEDE